MKIPGGWGSGSLVRSGLPSRRGLLPSRVIPATSTVRAPFSQQQREKAPMGVMDWFKRGVQK